MDKSRTPDKHSNNSRAIDKLLIDDKEIKESSKIADTLNNYFEDIGKNLLIFLH